MQNYTATQDPTISALSALLKESPSEQHSVALQVQHNLRYQQQWTSLTLHDLYGVDGAAGNSISHPSVHPILSGLPPSRLYIHPDEMIAHFASERKRENKERKLEQHISQSDRDNNLSMESIKDTMNLNDINENHENYLNSRSSKSMIDIPQREWVIPTRVHEPWTLRQLAAIFDKIESVPPEPNGQKCATTRIESWPRTKRAILAIIDDDSTVVYYIVHEGLVKPRQN